MTPHDDRMPVAKTYKMYVKGAFIRSEGGKVLRQTSSDGQTVAHTVRGTRKDFRDAVKAARGAQAGWAARSPFLRSQILFRMAEMLEDRRALFETALQRWTGASADEARRETTAAIERTFWYAGWADKFQSVLGNVNPVASPYFDFTVAEPVGVVTIVAPRNSALLGLVSTILPVIVSGNTCIVVASDRWPTVAVDLTEVIATSDVPGGVVNLLTGLREELVPTAAGHRDVDAIAYSGEDGEEVTEVRRLAADSVKRVTVDDDPAPEQWLDASRQSPYRIQSFVEWKTVWHPVGV